MSDSDSSEAITAKSARMIIGINFMNNPELIPAYWATVNASFQKIMDKFIVMDSWSYRSFKRLSDKLGIQLVFKSVLTQKGNVKQRHRHFEIATQVVYEAAKYQWLAPWRQEMTLGSMTCIKRQVGGLFLLHIFAFKQVESEPLVNRRQTVNFDTKDVKAASVFFDHFNKKVGVYGILSMPTNVKQQVTQAYGFLKDNHLVSYGLVEDDHPIDSPAIYLLGIKNNLALQHLATLKDFRDKLLFEACQGPGNSAFKELLQNGHRLNKLAQRSSAKSSETAMMAIGLDTISKFPLERKKSWAVDDVEELGKERDLAVIAFRLIEIFKYLTPQDPLTEERLTGRKHIQRLIANEIAEINLKNQREFNLRVQNSSRVLKRRQRKHIESGCSAKWENYLGVNPISDSKDSHSPNISEILAALNEEQNVRLQFFPEVAIICDDEASLIGSNACSTVATKSPPRSPSHQTSPPRNFRELSPDNGSGQDDSEWQTDDSETEFSDFDDELALADDLFGLSVSRSPSRKPSGGIFSKLNKKVGKDVKPQLMKQELSNSSWMNMPSWDSISDAILTAEPSISTSLKLEPIQKATHVAPFKTDRMKKRQLQTLLDEKVHPRPVKATEASTSFVSSNPNQMKCAGRDKSLMPKPQDAKDELTDDVDLRLEQLLKFGKFRLEIKARNEAPETWPNLKSGKKAVPKKQEEPTTKGNEPKLSILPDDTPVPGPVTTPYSLRTVRKKNPKYTS